MEQKRVLIVQDYKKVADLICLIFEDQVDAKYDLLQNTADIIDKLKQHQYDLLVLSFTFFEDAKDLEAEINEVKTEIGDIPILITSASSDYAYIKKFKSSQHKIGVLKYVDPPEVYKKIIVELIAIKDRGHRKPEDYMKMDIPFLLNLDTCPADLFIKINDEHYVKIFRDGDKIDPFYINKYVKKDVTEFYLRGTEYLGVTSMLIQKVSRSIQFDETNQDLLVSLSLSAHKTASQIVNKCGLRVEALESAIFAINMMNNILEKSPSTLKMLKKLSACDEIIAEHSIMLVYLSCGILETLGKNDYHNCEVITMAAFFHDITIKDPNIAFVQSIKEGLELGFSERMLIDYGFHPKVISEMLAQADELPLEVGQVVLQHHEKPDGSGFPEGLKADEIGELACIFIVVEDFIRLIYESGVTRETILIALGKMKGKYTEGHFTAAFEGLVKSIQQEDMSKAA